jgi:hypothetical protein
MLPELVHVLQGEPTGRTMWARLRSDGGCESRLVLWANVLHLISLRPLVGWGWGELDYAHYTTLYEGARFCDILDNAHNLPLHLAVELGIPFAVLACVAFLAWAWRQHPWRERGAPRQLAWAMLGLLFLHSLLEYPLWYGPFQLALGLCVAGLTRTSARPFTASSAWRRVLAGVLLLFGVGYVAWDYARVCQIYIAPERRLSWWRDDALKQAGRSWLFSGQGRFAELTLARPTPENAAWMYPLAQDVLHYSPEPRVVESLIESATLLGQERDAVFHLARYKAAFPREYQAWKATWRPPLPP